MGYWLRSSDLALPKRLFYLTELIPYIDKRSITYFVTFVKGQFLAGVDGLEPP